MDPDQDARWEAAQEGAELLREGSAAEAIDTLTRLAAADPHNEYAFLYLGHAWYDREDWEKALAAYVRALEIAPRHLGAMVGAGHALRMLGRLQQALRIGFEALRVAPDDADVLYLVGVLNFQRGEGALARRFLERFLETRPELEVGLEVRGMLQVLDGEVLPSPERDDEPDP